MTWLVTLACALSAACHLRFVVPRLREPAVADDDPPPHYAGLAPLRHVVLLALAVLVVAQVLHVVPHTQFVAWFGHLGAGGALAWVDLRTTWLPRTLNNVCLAQVVIGLAWLAVFDWQTSISGLAGGLVAFALFHLVWRFSAAFGYGDVRLAAIVGAMGGLGGLEGWLTTLLFGTLAGAVWAIVHAMHRRRHPGPRYFAYGPALWLGPMIAVTVSGW